ncbi:unnamed protein product [Ilex paraguariensis]|uniref:Uncharacterized protein n=1 Tax=Ilex paraguariensis TaxID=185542 RepID=A0ABC8U0A2_9AQUA
MTERRCQFQGKPKSDGVLRRKRRTKRKDEGMEEKNSFLGLGSGTAIALKGTIEFENQKGKRE